MLVNDIWGGELLFEWNTPVWEHDLHKGLRMLHLAIDTHLITSHFALPLLIRRPGGLVVEMTDGTREYNAEHYRLSAFYDLAKTAVIRLAFSQAEELKPHGCAAVALTPGWMRSEMMLENYAVTEDTWRDAAGNPHFAAISETPRFVGRAVAALAADPDVQSRNGGSFSSGGLAREYGFTDLDGSQPDCWRYMVEVQDPGSSGSDRLSLKPEEAGSGAAAPPRRRDDVKIRTWMKAPCCCSSAPCCPRASSSRSALRAPGCPCWSRSSRWACCSAPTGPAGSSSTTPSSRGRSASSASR